MIVFLDIDGTILNSNNCINKGLAETIWNFDRMNHFILCSARKPSATKKIAAQLKLKDEVIVCFNGALIMDENRIILEHNIHLNASIRIYNTVKEYGLTFNCFSYDQWIVEELDDMIENEMEITGENPQIIPDIKSEILKKTMHKILVLGDDTKIDSVIHRIRQIEGILAYKSKKGYLEINSAHAGKRRAFDFLVNNYFDDRTNTLAIGDGDNDLELIKSADIGIAMGNAPDLVKQSADYITFSNDSNGVEYALKKFLK